MQRGPNENSAATRVGGAPLFTAAAAAAHACVHGPQVG